MREVEVLPHKNGPLEGLARLWLSLLIKGLILLATIR